MPEYYAHSLEGKPKEEWQPLEEHLENVANLAAKFAEPFGGQEWARTAGLWHDVGKYSNEFQKKLYDANGVECHLETKPGRVVHSQVGGHLAQQVMDGGMERVFCWLIMGHHTGLADYSASESASRALEPKLRNRQIPAAIWEAIPRDIKRKPEIMPPQILLNKPRADISFLIRMLFSCVVDADFLDTEAFMDDKKSILRKREYPTIPKLLNYFDLHMDAVCRNAEPLPVNEIRSSVLERCRVVAEDEPTVFSLTVPTGGGKTLSSLAFALRHAVKHGKTRIIYVIPYTSIIEQTAKVFREIPGFEDAVLEHHCNILDDNENKETVSRRLASENWNAPIIVTTNVQFFESLYSCRTSRCRRLHNIANSVVIFDEAQCLPPQFLRPAVFAIRELQRHYYVTPLLCTATQPVLTERESFDFKFREGFDAVTEVVEQPSELSNRLKRVRVETFANLEPVGYYRIAESLLAEKQPALCIVNLKRDALDLSRRLPREQTVHLSTNMCAEHRLLTLDNIKQRLKSHEPLLLISTSVVEAGVDLDFPVVYRALAGLDSIAQAAGRCNREGKLSQPGKTVVFVPEKQPSYVQSVASLTRDHLSPEGLEKIFLPETFSRYFLQRFFQLGEQSLDEHNILGLLGRHLEYSFRTASERFRIIDDSWQLPVIVPYGEAAKLADELVQWGSKNTLRKLQRYTVTIPKNVVWKLLDEGHVSELTDYPGTYRLLNDGLYSDAFGFMPPDDIVSYEMETTIA